MLEFQSGKVTELMQELEVALDACMEGGEPGSRSAARGERQRGTGGEVGAS